MCKEVCIDDACAVLLFRVAVSLSLRVFMWSGQYFTGRLCMCGGRLCMCGGWTVLKAND